jgi:predicted nucleotidyltransferase component of viral defense system
MTFTFTTKETYLAQRTAWKLEYAQLSIDIRATKHAINNKQRENKMIYAELSLIRSRRAHATEMLEALAIAKIEAQRQYLLAKEELCLIN